MSVGNRYREPLNYDGFVIEHPQLMGEGRRGLDIIRRVYRELQIYFPNVNPITLDTIRYASCKVQEETVCYRYPYITFRTLNIQGEGGALNFIASSPSFVDSMKYLWRGEEKKIVWAGDSDLPTVYLSGLLFRKIRPSSSLIDSRPKIFRQYIFPSFSILYLAIHLRDIVTLVESVKMLTSINVINGSMDRYWRIRNVCNRRKSLIAT